MQQLEDAERLTAPAPEIPFGRMVGRARPVGILEGRQPHPAARFLSYDTTYTVVTERKTLINPSISFCGQRRETSTGIVFARED